MRLLKFVWLTALFLIPAACSRQQPAQDKEAAQDEGVPVQLAWKLSEGRALRYTCEIACDASGPMAMKGVLAMTVNIRAPKDGIALVDTALSRFVMDTEGVPPPSESAMAQAFELHLILDEEGGLDPYGVLARQQRNFFEIFFPLPTNKVAVGQEWPLKIQMLSLGPGATGQETNVALLERIDRDGEKRIATIGLQSSASVATEAQEHIDAMEASMSVSGSATFDLTGGHLIANELAASIPMPEEGTMKGTFRVSLLAEETLETGKVKELLRVLEVRQAVHQSIKLSKEGKSAEALALLDPLIDAEAHDEHAPLIAAQIHSRNGDWDEAEKAIEVELERFPDNTQVLLSAWAIYRQVGEKDKAEAAAHRRAQIMRQ